MPKTGSAPNQTFQRTDGTRTGSQTWQEADAASVDIIATDHDTHDQDIADGISGCVFRDGGNTATGNLPMGGFRHTGVGDATGDANYLSAKQFMNAAGQYAPTVGGTANAITLTTGFSHAALAAGEVHSFIVGTTNTGATTVNVDSLGVKALVRSDGSNTALAAGDLVAGSMVEIQYDGTRFHLRSSSLTSASSDVLARIVKVGSVIAWPMTTVPSGWLEADGSAVSRTTYAELFTAYGTAYGVGDGSTTFNLPDYTDEFLRGFDASGTDAGSRTDRGDGTTGASVGTKQTSANIAHTHTGTTSTDGEHTHSYTVPIGAQSVGAGGSSNLSTSTADTTGSNGSHSHTFTTASSGGTEARPRNVTVKWIILALPAAASAGTLGVHGLQYVWSTSTSGDPGAGKLLVNNATLASATALNISETDANSAGVSAFLATWDDSTSTINGFIHVTKVGAPGDFIIYSTSGSLTDSGSYDEFTVSHVAGNGTFANGVNVSVLFYRNGDKGDTGATGATGAAGATGVDAGLRFNFDSSTSMADPGAGDIRLNNATLASVTAIAVDDTSADSGNPDVSTFVLAWDDSTTTSLRGTLVIKKLSAPENFAIYSITGSSTDNSGWTELAVTHVSSAGSFTNADALSVAFTRTGNAGAGTGDVVGPASATDNAIVRYDGTTGKLVQDSAVTIADTTGVVTGAVFPNTGLKVLDTNASHSLVFSPGSDLTAERTLTVTTGDADRTLTLTASSSIGGTAYVAGGTDVALADGGTGASLADPGADRIMFWDDSAGAVDWLTAGNGLTITTTTIAVDTATTSVDGIIELATTAEYLANTADRGLSTDQVNAAGALFGLTDGASIAWDMASGFNASVTLGGNRTLANPTNTIVGRTGAIVVTQDGTGTRTLAYGTSWEAAGGTFPVLSTTAGAKDTIFYWVQSSTSIIITGILKALA